MKSGAKRLWADIRTSFCPSVPRTTVWDTDMADVQPSGVRQDCFGQPHGTYLAAKRLISTHLLHFGARSAGYRRTKVETLAEGCVFGRRFARMARRSKLEHLAWNRLAVGGTDRIPAQTAFASRGPVQRPCPTRNSALRAGLASMADAHAGGGSGSTSHSYVAVSVQFGECTDVKGAALKLLDTFTSGRAPAEREE